jgi:hypothetical protein
MVSSRSTARRRAGKSVTFTGTRHSDGGLMGSCTYQQYASGSVNNKLRFWRSRRCDSRVRVGARERGFCAMELRTGGEKRGGDGRTGRIAAIRGTRKNVGMAGYRRERVRTERGCESLAMWFRGLTFILSNGYLNIENHPSRLFLIYWGEGGKGELGLFWFFGFFGGGRGGRICEANTAPNPTHPRPPIEKTLPGTREVPRGDGEGECEIHAIVLPCVHRPSRAMDADAYHRHHRSLRFRKFRTHAVGESWAGADHCGLRSASTPRRLRRV